MARHKHLGRRVLFQLVVWAIGLAAIPMATPTAFAQTANEQTVGVPSQTFRDWQLLKFGAGGDTPADEPGSCQLRYSAALRQGGSNLLTVDLVPRKAGQTEETSDTPFVIVARVPLGASLVSGIAYRHTDQRADSNIAQALVWQYCTATQCLASTGISAEEVNRMRAGRAMEVAFRPLPNSRPLAVPVSLLGISAALNALDDCG